MTIDTGIVAAAEAAHAPVVTATVKPADAKISGGDSPEMASDEIAEFMARVVPWPAPNMPPLGEIPIPESIKRAAAIANGFYGPAPAVGVASHSMSLDDKIRSLLEDTGTTASGYEAALKHPNGGFDPQPTGLTQPVLQPPFWSATQLKVSFSNIPHRHWLYGTYLIRGEITVLAAPGGVGKTALATGIAVEIATGIELLGEKIYG
jgi:hypothetical protein